MANPLQNDLDHILAHAGHDLDALAGQRIFITGGTGFFGLWILETLAWANVHRQAGIEAVVLTRNPAAMHTTAPHLADNTAFEFVEGDIRDFEFPTGEFSTFIHGATTTARETFNNEDPLRKFETVALGTQTILECAATVKPEKFLYLGSGACYGPQPTDMTTIPESYTGTPPPESPNSALGIGKRAAEFFCHYYGDKYDLDIKLTRCFSFYGPHLPLDIHYAIGNFIGDAVANRDIQVQGDGTPLRSYLYIADLVIWLLRILNKGERLTPYNVGSPEAVSIGSLAQRIANIAGTQARLGQTPTPGTSPNRYVPDVSLAQSTLDLEAHISLDDGIRRMLDYQRQITDTRAP